MLRIGPAKLHALLKALVPIRMKNAHRPGISGSAACSAGWVRLPGPPPQYPTSSSPRWG